MIMKTRNSAIKNFDIRTRIRIPDGDFFIYFCVRAVKHHDVHGRQLRVLPLPSHTSA